MNIGVYSKKNIDLKIDDNIITFTCSKPMVIQSSEIKRVQTDIMLEIESGFILTIFTEPSIYEMAAEVFPGPYILDSGSPKKMLEIPIRNNAGSPLHLLENAVIARGYLTEISKVSVKEIEPVQETKSSRKKSTPAKRNTDIKFEVR